MILWLDTQGTGDFINKTLLIRLSIALLLAIVLFMPKKLTWREMYYSFGIIGFLTWMSDVFIADVFKGFQLGPTPAKSITDFIFVIIVAPFISLIFLNFMPDNSPWWYGSIWAMGSFLYEWCAVASGYMTNKWWRTWYSIPVFLAVFLIVLPWHLKIMRHKVQNTNGSRQTISYNSYKGGLRIRKKAR